MSDFLNDRKVLDGKRDALPDVAAPLRDQIPAKLLKKLNELNMGQKAVSAWMLGNANRADWLERQQTYLSDWDEFLESTAEGPFTGSSSLHIPMPFIVAKAMHARFMQALFGVDPFFNVKSRTSDFRDRAPMILDIMSYAVKEWCNYRKGIESAADRWLWDWITAGSGLMKAKWDCKYRRFIDVKSVPQKAAPKYSVGPDGKETVDTNQIEYVDKEVATVKTVFEGPVFYDIRLEDFNMVGGDGDPQLADVVQHREYLTASELWTLADRKIFDEDAVREVIEHGYDNPSAAINSNIKFDRSVNAGKAQLKTSVELDRYEILETYMNYDVDDSGINAEIVYWVHLRTHKILRATYLDRINKAGERPFFKIDFHRRTGQDFGIGIIEVLHPLSKEMDAIHNMRIDFGLLSTMPFGFYRPTSSLNPEKIELEPGVLIPLDNPQTDVHFPNLGVRTAFGNEEERNLQTLIERLTGVNDLNMGVLTGAQGATRTATGTQALQQEGNTNLDVHLRRLNTGWKQCLQYLLHMLQQRIPKGLSFRVTGEDGDDYWQQVRDASEIAGDFDFEVSSNSVNSNKSLLEQTAQDILQLISNPLYIQTGVVQVPNLYEGLKNWLKVKGVKEFNKYINKPQGYEYSPTPEEEANALLRGQNVPINPAADHQGFVDYVQYILAHDELLGQFDEQQTVTLAKQMKQHEQMLQAMKSQQAQTANAQQMQANAGMGASQQAGAPAGGNNGGIQILGKGSIAAPGTE